MAKTVLQVNFTSIEGGQHKLLELAKVFCIDVCAYAVTSNHKHLILYIDVNHAKK